MKLASVKISLVLFGLFLFPASTLHADKSWSNSSVKLIQTKLNDLGYSAGPVDGAWGKKTSSALTLYCEEYEHDCSDAEEKVIDLLATDTDDSYLDVEMDLASAVWFENRIGYGTPKDRVDRYVGKTRREAIDLVIDELRTHKDGINYPAWVQDMQPLGGLIHATDSETLCNKKYLKSSLIESWIGNALSSEIPQFERISTFWLDHFSVAYDDYIHPHVFAEHLKFVRSWREGSYLDLLQGSLRDASTLIYLNNDQSTSSAPNENLAREFLELFALGEGNYDEKEVRSLALLFTGHGFNLADERYHFYPEHAHSGQINIFGERVNSIEKFFEVLREQEAISNYLVSKFYEEFVSLDEIRSFDLKRISRRFAKSNFHIVVLFEAVISSKVFWESSTNLTLIKSPKELIIGSARTLNSYGEPQRKRDFIRKANYVLSDLGQSLFDPPSIEGWPTGTQWISGQKIDQRAKVLSNIFKENYDEVSPPTLRGAKDAWTKLKYNEKYKQELNEFFSKAEKDQLLIEHIAIPWVSEKFFEKDYGFVDVIFHNLVINELHIPQIHLHLKREKNRNVVQFEKFNISTNFLKNARFSTPENELWYTIELPLSSGDKDFKSLPKLDRVIIKKLIRAMSIVFKPQDIKIYRREIDKNKPAKEWLKARILDEGKLIDLSENASSVQLFAINNRFDKIQSRGLVYFNCDAGLGEESVRLEEYFSSSDTTPFSASGSKLDFNYLLPLKTQNLNELSLSAILSSVEYNLK